MATPDSEEAVDAEDELEPLLDADAVRTVDELRLLLEVGDTLEEHVGAGVPLAVSVAAPEKEVEDVGLRDSGGLLVADAVAEGDAD